MREKRRVRFSLLYKAFKLKFPIAFIGFIFILLATLVFFPLILILNSSKDQYEKYDYKNILEQGKDLKAKVTSTNTQYNVTVNNVFHPQIVTYTFEENGKVRDDKFKTLIGPGHPGANKGDSVNIKMFRGETVLKDMEPFTFPLRLLYIGPTIFLLLGIPLFLIGFLPLLKDYRLCKYGVKREATILAMTVTSLIPFIPYKQNLLVHYFYIGKHGNKIFGQSLVAGLWLLAEKKSQDSIDIFVSAKNENYSCVVPKELL